MSNDNNECSICLKNIINDNKFKLKCNHEYHYDCIQQWLNKHDTCPICRTADTYFKMQKTFINQMQTLNFINEETIIHTYSNLPNNLKNDIYFLIKIIEIRPFIYNHLSESLKKNKKIVKEYYNNVPLCVKDFNKFDESLQHDPFFMKIINVYNLNEYNQLPKFAQNDVNLITRNVLLNKLYLYDILSDELKQNMKIICIHIDIDIMEQNHRTILKIPNDIKQTKEFNIQMFDRCYVTYDKLPDKLKTDKHVICKLCHYIYRYDNTTISKFYKSLSKELKKSKRILHALKKGIARVIKKFRDPKIMYEYKQFPNVLKKSKIIVMAILKCHHSSFINIIIDDIPLSLLNDKHVALELLKINPKYYNKLSYKMRNRYHIALEAVKNDGLIIKYLPEKLACDKKISNVAIDNNCCAMNYIS